MFDFTWQEQGTSDSQSSHCNACKLLSGGENTMNQMGNKEDLKITKGSTKVYTYHGDSGTIRCLPSLPFSRFTINTESC